MASSQVRRVKMRLVLLDGLLAVLAAASAVRNVGDHLGALPLAVVAVAPLVVRRRWPAAVFGWLVAWSAGFGLWSVDTVPGVALLVALYTVAASRPRTVALGAGAVLEAGVLVAAVRLPGNWVKPAVFLTGMLVAALGLGLYVAAHRAYVAGLHDRALALERDRDREAELAAAAERARIARDMHDVVAHHLTVMVALSDGAAVAEPGRAAEVMRMVSETGRRALAETRRVVGVLRAPDPPPPPAVPAAAPDLQPARGRRPRPAVVAADRQPAPGVAELGRLVRTVRSAGLPTTLAVTGPAEELPPGVQLAAYRIVQEALTNSLRHAGPGARAAVRLDSTAEQLVLEVTDEGGGPAPVGVGGGSGLVGIRERVLACGGEVSAGPADAGGWRVTVRLRAAP
jgi:signal transduction histidine kinase